MGALRAHLETLRGQALVVGKTAESPRAFYSCVVEADQDVMEFGVCSSNLGSAPGVIALGGSRIILVGHDTWLTWVNVAERVVAQERRLGGAFFEFLPVNRDDEVVVLHELGALRVNASASEAWSIDTDVVQDFRLDGSGGLVLSIMDRSSPLVVSVESGDVRG